MILLKIYVTCADSRLSGKDSILPAIQDVLTRVALKGSLLRERDSLKRSFERLKTKLGECDLLLADLSGFDAELAKEMTAAHFLKVRCLCFAKEGESIPAFISEMGNAKFLKYKDAENFKVKLRDAFMDMKFRDKLETERA